MAAVNVTVGLVRTSRAPSLSCAAAGLRMHNRERVIRSTSANGRAHVVMELVLAKRSLYELLTGALKVLVGVFAMVQDAGYSYLVGMSMCGNKMDSQCKVCVKGCA